MRWSFLTYRYRRISQKCYGNVLPRIQHVCLSEHEVKMGGRDSKGYDPHPSLYGVSEQQASGSVDLLVLFLDVARYLLQHLQHRTACWGEAGRMGKSWCEGGFKSQIQAEKGELAPMSG